MIRINDTVVAPRHATVEAFVVDETRLAWGVDIAASDDSPTFGADRLFTTASGELDGWCGLAGQRAAWDRSKIAPPYVRQADRFRPIERGRFALESTGVGLGILWQGSLQKLRFEIAVPVSEIVLQAGTADSEARARSLFEPFLPTADFDYEPDTRRLVRRFETVQ